MSTEQQTKYFTERLRSVLYISGIMLYEVEALKSAKATPFVIANGCKRIENAVKFFLSDCMVRCSPETWAKVKQDLNSDQLHDISNLLDMCASIENVGDLVSLLKENLLFLQEPKENKI